MTTEARMPDPTPIRGRWTLKGHDAGPAQWITGSTLVVGGRPLGAGERIEVVPVPDEQAIERAARAMYERGYPEDVRESWEAYAARQPDIAGRFRESVRAVLAAALGQPE
jgi:hypothetical protein